MLRSNEQLDRSTDKHANLYAGASRSIRFMQASPHHAGWPAAMKCWQRAEPTQNSLRPNRRQIVPARQLAIF
jgi:hypothetical protein